MTGHIATAEVSVDATPERVWKCLTEPDLVAAWMMGSRLQTDWTVGGPITWAGEFDGKSYEDKGQVKRVVPGERLTVTHWSPMSGEPETPDNTHTLDYTLSPEGDRTQLKLEQDNCADEDQAAEFAKNWQSMLDALKGVAEQT